MDLFDELARTPALLARVAESTPEALVRTRSGPFAFVEHAWHVADLEREGFGERIARLLAEPDPFLPDFDGERIAREREYLKAELAPALPAFAAARSRNLAALRVVQPAQWSRAGRQEGVGTVTLAELPRRMHEHDLAHLNEIADLLAEIAPAHPMIAELREVARGAPRSSRAA